MRANLRKGRERQRKDDDPREILEDWEDRTELLVEGREAYYDRLEEEDRMFRNSPMTQYMYYFTKLKEVEGDYLYWIDEFLDQVITKLDRLREAYQEKFGKLEAKYRRYRNWKTTCAFRIEPVVTHIARFSNAIEVLNFALAIRSDGDWPYLLDYVKRKVRHDGWRHEKPVRQLASGMVLPHNVLKILRLLVGSGGILISPPYVEDYIDPYTSLVMDLRKGGTMWQVVVYGLAFERDSWLDEFYEELLARLTADDDYYAHSECSCPGCRAEAPTTLMLLSSRIAGI